MVISLSEVLVLVVSKIGGKLERRGREMKEVKYELSLPVLPPPPSHSQ